MISRFACLALARFSSYQNLTVASHGRVALITLNRYRISLI